MRSHPELRSSNPNELEGHLQLRDRDPGTEGLRERFWAKNLEIWRGRNVYYGKKWRTSTKWRNRAYLLRHLNPKVT
jgi:hypothetical protein